MVPLFSPEVFLSQGKRQKPWLCECAAKAAFNSAVTLRPFVVLLVGRVGIRGKIPLDWGMMLTPYHEASAA